MSKKTFGLSFVGGKGRVAYVESVAFAAERQAEPGPGDGNLVVERLTCGHFFWQKCSYRAFTSRSVAARVGKRRRCAHCCGMDDSIILDFILSAFDAAHDKRFFGEPW